MKSNNFNKNVYDICDKVKDSKTIEKSNGIAQNNYVYVDIQGFRLPMDHFICKEYCLINDDGYKFHKIVKSQESFDRLPSIYIYQAIWLMRHHHKIGFDRGDIDPFDLRREIFSKL